MTSPGEWELGAALVALDRIADLVAAGQQAFDTSRDRQLALVFCWVNVGSLLKQFVRRTQLDITGDALGAPIKMRDKLLYGRLQDLRADIVWDTCVLDGPRLRTLIADLFASI